MNKALVVGVYRYRNDTYQTLKGPWSDVGAVRNALRQPRSAFAPGRGDIETLWNPTEDVFRTALTDLFDDVDESDQVLVYFSGQTDGPGENGGLSLTGRDSDPGSGNRPGLSTNDLRAHAANSGARSVQVIIDGARTGTRQLNTDDLVHEDGSLGRNRSFAVLAATSAATAADAGRLGELSGFTRALIDDLESERAVEPGADLDLAGLAERLGAQRHASGLDAAVVHVEGDPAPILHPATPAKATAFAPAERSRGVLMSALIAFGVLALAFALPRLSGSGSTSVATDSELAGEQSSAEAAGSTVTRSAAPTTTAAPPSTLQPTTPTSARTALSTVAPDDISSSTEAEVGAATPSTTRPASTTSAAPVSTSTTTTRVPAVRPDIPTTIAGATTTAPTTTSAPSTTVAPTTTVATTTTAATPPTTATVGSASGSGGPPTMPSGMSIQASFSDDPALTSGRYRFEQRAITTTAPTVRTVRFTDSNDGETFYRVRVRDYRLDRPGGSCASADGFQVLTCIVDTNTGSSRAVRLDGFVEADFAGINGSGQAHSRTIPDLRGQGDNNVSLGPGWIHCIDMRAITDVTTELLYSNWTKPQCFLGGAVL